MVRIQRSDKWDEIAHRDNDGVYVLPDVNRMFAVALLSTLTKKNKIKTHV